jgi:hypothetical protein
VGGSIEGCGRRESFSKGDTRGREAEDQRQAGVSRGGGTGIWGGLQWPRVLVQVWVQVSQVSQVVQRGARTGMGGCRRRAGQAGWQAGLQAVEGDAGGAGVRRGLRYAVRMRDKRP